MADIVIVGGLGHVGLPLGIVFAEKGQEVCLYDINPSVAKLVNNGVMPFIEYGAEEILQKVLKEKKLFASIDIREISRAKYVIIAIGTPVDEYLNPKVRGFLEVFEEISKYLNPEQTIIVRSTVYPRTCNRMLKMLGPQKGWQIAYCPERIVQGYAVKELGELPQVIAGLSAQAVENAEALFALVSPKIIRASMEEAELIKLFTNAWRYIQFAVTNQFYMIATRFGVDYKLLRERMTEGYGRAASLPTAGFAAGPCLLKDTMQLAAFQGNNFVLGHAAMFINEGLPNFVVENLKKDHQLEGTTIGILGMAFKAEIDDIRDSLAFKLGKVLLFHGANVKYSDEYAEDPYFVSKEEIVASCEIIIVGVPHHAYQKLAIPPHIKVVDLWGVIASHQPPL